jgi:hypothetical protein
LSANVKAASIMLTGTTNLDRQHMTGASIE